MRFIFAPYNLGSEGCKSLSRNIGGIRSKAEKRFKRDVVLVNWGRSDLIARGQPRLIVNHPRSVALATNKLLCLDRLKANNVSSVEHTTSMTQVMKWLAQPDSVVYGRKLLNASQGKGIVIIKSLADIVPCPLYTRGILKSHEYRVHVFKDSILDVTKKRRRNSQETNDYIKNLANGWVYCREGIEIPENLLQCAKDCIRALGLDFGAVDLLYRKGQPYVLEVNTAPGLQGTTLIKYTEAFNNFKRGLYGR